jgi:hypothetical protein
MIFEKSTETMLYPNNVFHSIFFKCKHNLQESRVQARWSSKLRIVFSSRDLSVQTVRDQLVKFYSTCRITSLRPGQSPPQVIIPAFTHWGSKYISLRGPALCTLEKTWVCVRESLRCEHFILFSVVTIVQPSCNQGQCIQLQQMLVRQT